jgi:anti-anti-sigma factor
VSAVEIESADGVPVARPLVDIDADSVGEVHERLIATLGPDTDALILDLSSTRYIDSAGLDMLFRLNARLSQRRAALLVVIPASSQLSRLARIVALPEVMEVHETVQDAQRVCAQRPKERMATPPDSAERCAAGDVSGPPQVP